MLAFFSTFHRIRLHFFNRRTSFHSIRAEEGKEREGSRRVKQFPSLRSAIFDFSPRAMPRPCRTDISYERWNNYTGRVWGESRSAEGKRQFYAAGAPPSLATRWQPSFLLTIRPTKSTARPVFHGNQRCRRSKTLFNVPEMKYIADTLSLSLSLTLSSLRFGFLFGAARGWTGVEGRR